MINFLKYYKAFGIGIVLTILLRVILEYIGFIRIDSSNVLENTLYFIFWAFVLSLPIHKFSYLKEKKNVVFKILALLALLILTVSIDQYINIPDNPLTVFLLVSFWIGVIYVIIPSFIHRYRWYILVIYTVALMYFTMVRQYSESFEYYLAHDKGLAFAFFLVPIPVFFLIWTYEQWKWLKSLKADKSKAELELLKTQVNPHFFFNTLNNLYSLTVKHSDKAPEVILKLSEMMRYTIYEGKKDLVPIQEEVVYLNNYIDLHKIRYHKKVDIQFANDIGENDTIAPLLFIILLENAFKHGIESLSDSAYIKMNLTSKNQEVRFTMENNFDPNEISEEKGIGLENLRRRLGLIYPKSHEFTIAEHDNVFKVDLIIRTK